MNIPKTLTWRAATKAAAAFAVAIRFVSSAPAQPAAPPAVAPSADFFISPQGNDGWTGKLAAPNADNTDGPFATLRRARLAVRVVKSGQYRDIHVLIRGGEYRFAATEVFTPADSHYDSFAVYYMSYPGEEPVFSSDLEVTGWQLATDVPGLPATAQGKVYRAPIPRLPEGKARFYTMYDNGRPVPRARSKGFVPTKDIKGGDGGGMDFKGVVEADRTSLWFPPGALRAWPNLDDIEVVVEPVGYVINYLPLASVDEKAGLAVTALPASYPMTRQSFAGAFDHGHACVENAIDHLDTPGEWVLDTRAGAIYYWPIDGTPGKVAVPALTEYVRIDGHELGGIVRNVAFRGLTFTRGDRYRITAGDSGLQHDWDVWNRGNALVRLRDAEYCHVEACRFTRSGGGGVRLDLHCQSNEVKNNLVEHLGGTGILLCGYGPGALHVNKANRILNNHVHHCGQLHYQSAGIMVWQSGENIIRHNRLHHLPYSGIILSGMRPGIANLEQPNREVEGTIRRWELPPSAQFQSISTNFMGQGSAADRDSILGHWNHVAPFELTRHNLIEDNELFRCVEKLFDGNAIYLSDTGNGNVIRRNFIHHFRGGGMQSSIRTDAFIKHTLITDNVLYRNNGGGISVRYWENHVLNNIVADCRETVETNAAGRVSRIFLGYLGLYAADRNGMPPHTRIAIERNILYKTSARLPFYRVGAVRGRKVEATEEHPTAGKSTARPAPAAQVEMNLEACDIDRNLYFDTEAPDHGAAALAAYRARGIEPNGVVGDPLFMDVARGDFRFRAGSAAEKIGFREIDVRQTGLTPEFPARLARAVRDQLGADYDAFTRLADPARD